MTVLCTITMLLAEHYVEVAPLVLLLLLLQGTMCALQLHGVATQLSENRIGIAATTHHVVLLLLLLLLPCCPCCCSATARTTLGGSATRMLRTCCPLPSSCSTRMHTTPWQVSRQLLLAAYHAVTGMCLC
jgi:hypothetical protein